jgi:hypothetical protein
MADLIPVFPKIYGPFKRFTDGPDRNKIDRSRWYSPDFEVVKDCNFVWTEKIDGTNIRVHWDGHKPTFAGRTDRAQIHGDLINRLTELFPEELFEQTFGAKEVTLFGEGYGPGIQKGGGNYGTQKDFVLFDVLIGGLWLERSDIGQVADDMGIDMVPLRYIGSPLEVIDMMSKGLIVKSSYGEFDSEGVVGTMLGGFLTRRGDRVQLKIKVCDYGPNA